jgi:hypothetical protein
MGLRLYLVWANKSREAAEVSGYREVDSAAVPHSMVGCEDLTDLKTSGFRYML